MCPGSRGADVSQSGCAPSAVPRRWRRPLGHGRPAAEPAGRGATAHGEIRPEPGLCPAQKPPELGSPATGTRGSGTGVNGITPAEIHQVYQGSLQRSGFNRGLRRPEHSQGAAQGPRGCQDLRLRRVFIFALGRALSTFPAALIRRHYLQIFTRLLSHCKTASMTTWCSQPVSGVLWG